jgi:all-trans-retinol 13,14-reductase
VTRRTDKFDLIVIGSGIGWLACACALTRSGLKVLVLEKHRTAGGLTQTFSRAADQCDAASQFQRCGRTQPAYVG